ncbi:hypothetical protein B0T21DRAFT_344505 [Apiosordaria backusii]|uniref:Uncharacterized protein n=1 Tax=Apiosordaria backusii TaxID=314023 RepID=A0AA40ERR7_9PEZI|nr:hypothetical protein B0T21DRAFT_344505 [Apiosordaria backusii]
MIGLLFLLVSVCYLQLVASCFAVFLVMFRLRDLDDPFHHDSNQAIPPGDAGAATGPASSTTDPAGTDPAGAGPTGTDPVGTGPTTAPTPVGPTAVPGPPPSAPHKHNHTHTLPSLP